MKRQVTRAKAFTGWHMTAILVGGFGVVIAVNVLMASLASSTFGGIVVENSYVASQHFNRWLGEARKEEALGWAVDVRRTADNRLIAQLKGVPEGAVVVAEARHPLGRLPDVAMRFERAGHDGFVSDVPLPAGRWTLRLRIEAAGSTWRGERVVA